MSPEAVRMRVCVTGVNGFVGRHLAAELSRHGIEVIGIGMEAAAETSLESYVRADLGASWPAIPPVDAVIHLAGLAAVGPSFGDPQRYLNVNSSIVTNLGEALIGSSTRIVLVSSGAIYDGAASLPLAEDAPIALTSPYAVSKLLNEHQAAYYRSRGLDIVVARPFNHIGPGQGSGFLLPDLVHALAARNDLSAPIKTGNLQTRRDYTDVRDVASAYRLLATRPALSHKVYNICSGRSRSGRELLDELGTALGLDHISTETDPDRIRPTDPLDIVGDSSRLLHDTGWSPEFTIAQTIADYLEGAG